MSPAIIATDPQQPSPSDGSAMSGGASMASPPVDEVAKSLPDSGGLSPQPSAGASAGPAKFFGKGKHSGEAFDPIEANGPIFVDWPKPKLALLFSGRQDGYLEPCGCAGLDRMKGGLSRRDSLVKDLRDRQGWTVVPIDVGGQVKTYGRQAVLKFQTTVEALKAMEYQSVALGKNDLRLGAGELVAYTAPVPGQPSPFTASNVGIFDFNPELMAPYRVIDAAGMKIGVTSILGKAWQKDLAALANQGEVVLADPAEKLREVVPRMQAESNLLVLLSHATMEESVALAKEFPQFDVVVTAGGAPLPPISPQRIGERTMLIEVGEKVMDVVVLGLFDDPAQPYRYQRVPLDSRFEASPTMRLLMVNYQEQLEREGLEGLGIRPVPHPLASSHGGFVGSQKCESCHEISYKIWKKTGHAKGWETLVNLDPPRVHDPECISCHVVGWHPTDYFPYETGYLSGDKTEHLVDVGCEDCHGPGEKHVAAEMGGNAALQTQLRQAMVVSKEQARDSHAHWCINCHDLDNSPDFEFDAYWPQVEHYEGIHGKESPVD